MSKFAFPLALSAVAASLAFSTPASAVSADVQAAIDLMKQTRADLCQKKKIQVQLLIAHQSHDRAKLDALGPQLDAVNHRLKPSEDQLNALKSKFRKNPDDQSAFESAQLQQGDCE